MREKPVVTIVKEGNKTMLNVQSRIRAHQLLIAIFGLMALASLQQVRAQATLERPRDPGLKKNETVKVQKLPDLIVTNIQYSGSHAAITVHNKGAEKSAPSKVKFTLAGENWTVPVPALLPNGFVYTAKISRNQAFAGKGIAKVDPENEIFESNETNNSLTIDQPAVFPDIAAIEISFRDEGSVTNVVGTVKNVSKTNLIDSNVTVSLRRIALYGAHQNILDFKTENLKNLGPGTIHEVKAPMPKSFPGADSYIWILIVNGDGHEANNSVEKKSVKID